VSKSAFEQLQALADSRWIAIDTETTGVGPHDQVVEIAILRADGGVLVDSTVRPDRPIPATATAIHGLDTAALDASPSWPEVWGDVRVHLLEATLVAWNAAFDVRLIRQTCARNRLPFRLQRFVCLREAFQWRYPKSRASLAAACLALGLADRPAHRAKPDAEIARQVALRLVKPDPLAD